MITTIIFDLGGVLFTNGSRKFQKYLSQTYSLDEASVHDVISGVLGSAYRSGVMGQNEFWRKVRELFRIPESAEVLENRWQSGYKLIEETRDLILALRKKYNIYYLSDNVKKRVDYLESTYHFLQWFDGGVFSHETGTRKPDPKIYELMLNKYRLKAEECVYIDDKPHFLEPAKALGMKTIQCTDPKNLKKQFSALRGESS